MVDAAVGKSRIGSGRGDDGLVSMDIECRSSSRRPQYLGCGVRQIRAQTVQESFRFQIDEECGVWVMSKIDLAAEMSSKVMYVKCQK